MLLLPVIGFINSESVIAFGFFICLVFVAVIAWRSSSFELVVKQWYVSNVPRADGSYLSISGRRSGLVGWLLSVLGLDPTITLSITDKKITLHTTSIGGISNRITPLGTVSSSSFGYSKPWLGSLLVWLLSFPFFFALFSFVMEKLGFYSLAESFISLLLSAGVAFLLAQYYFRYNKSLTLGYVELSGVAAQIRFKPSVIEGVNIDERQAEYAAKVMQHLIQVRIDR